MTSQSQFLSEAAQLERHEPVDLSIIMPCFNEAEAIEKVVAEWKQILSEEKISNEIIIVNDGSSDGTGRILDKIRRDTKGVKVIHQLNSGASKATRRGYELARGKFVLHAEANARFEPLDFLRLWEKRHESAHIISYRTHRLDNLLRRLFSKCQRYLLRKFLQVDIQDPGVSFRLIRRDIALAALKQIPSQTQALNLWFTVIIAKLTSTPSVEIAVPFRQRLSCRIRRKNRGIFAEAIANFRDLMVMKYGDGNRPGIAKLPALTANPPLSNPLA